MSEPLFRESETLLNLRKAYNHLSDERDQLREANTALRDQLAEMNALAAPDLPEGTPNG